MNRSGSKVMIDLTKQNGDVFVVPVQVVTTMTDALQTLSNSVNASAAVKEGCSAIKNTIMTALNSQQCYTANAANLNII